MLLLHHLFFFRLFLRARAESAAPCAPAAEPMQVFLPENMCLWQCRVVLVLLSCRVSSRGTMQPQWGNSHSPNPTASRQTLVWVLNIQHLKQSFGLLSLVRGAKENIKQGKS